MAKKNKLGKFSDILSYPNVYENYDPKDPKLIKDKETTVDMKGKWSTGHFENDNPIVLELACGRGEYCIALAEVYPEKNFIGVDVKGARIWKGATIALMNKINNVAFLRTRIEQIGLFIDQNEIEEIWITFPDPQIKYKRTKHRMTNSEFLKLYKRILKPDGVVNLKTDSEFMHGYTLGLLQGEGHDIIYANHNVYNNEGSPEEVTGIQTFYEKQYLEINKPITYIRFKIK